MKSVEPRLFEFRIKYNAGEEVSALDSYHYYMAVTADQAYDFHIQTMTRVGTPAQHLSVERKNPWNGKWEDVSEVLNRQSVRIENED